jgi:hypothetical protein
MKLKPDFHTYFSWQWKWQDAHFDLMMPMFDVDKYSCIWQSERIFVVVCVHENPREYDDAGINLEIPRRKWFP